MKLVASITIAAVSFLVGCSDSGPAPEHIAEAMNAKTSDYIRVVGVDVHDVNIKPIKNSDTGQWYSVNFDYEVEFLKSHDEVYDQARLIGNIPMLSQLEAIVEFDEEKGAFDKGEKRTTKGASAVFHDIRNNTALRLQRINGDRDDHPYIIWDKKVPLK